MVYATGVKGNIEPIIRLANEADARGIAAVVVTSWQAAYRGIISDEGLNSLSVEERKDCWRKRLQNNDWTTLVCERVGAVVGFAAYSPCHEEDKDCALVGELVAMYLLPEYCGQGFGKQLMAEVLRRFKRLAFSEVILWVLEGNYRASKFYETFGFRADGLKNPDVIRGSKVIKVRYVKKL